MRRLEVNVNTYSSTLMQERSDSRANGGQPTTNRVRPITVALVNDYEIILRGLHSMLTPFSDRIEVVEHETSGTPDKPADVALFDTFASRRDALDRAREMIAEGKRQARRAVHVRRRRGVPRRSRVTSAYPASC